MGLAEVLPRLPKLLRRIRETGDAVGGGGAGCAGDDRQPGLLACAWRGGRGRLRPGLRVIHYVAPSVWAWRPGRAAKMARVVDHVLALLPFEPPYMEAAGMTCDFVGHPVAAEPQATPAEVAALRAELGVAPGQRLLALLPGSRRGRGDAARAGLRRGGAPAAGRAAGARGGACRRRRRWSTCSTGWCARRGGLAARARSARPAGGRGEARKRAAFAAADAALAASGHGQPGARRGGDADGDRLRRQRR